METSLRFPGVSLEDSLHVPATGVHIFGPTPPDILSFMRPLLLTVACSIALCLLSACQSTAPTTGAYKAESLHWSAAAPLNHARAAHAVVATRDAIFALAGTSDAMGRPVSQVERFDGMRWQDETTLPGDGLNAPAAAIIDDQIYLLGGFKTTTNIPTDEVHIYNTLTRRWSRGPSLPEPRGGHAAAVLNGRIHIIGGGNSRSTLALHSVLDPRTGRWVERAPLPRAIGSPAAVVRDGKLYCIGGRSGRSDFGDVFIYDEGTNAWTPGPSIVPRGTSGAVNLNDNIFVIGGESQADSAVLNDVLQLAPGATAWTTTTPMPTPRGFARAVIYRNSIYVVGGSVEPQTSHAPRGTAVVERLDAMN